MDKGKYFISPILFALVLICFLFPFISAFGESLNGVDLIKKALDAGAGSDSKDILAFAALVCQPIIAAAGLGTGFWRHRTGQIISCLLGAAGFIAALGLKIMFDNELGGASFLGVEVGAAYYMIILLFLGAAICNAVLLFSKTAVVPSYSPGAAGLWQNPQPYTPVQNPQPYSPAPNPQSYAPAPHQESPGSKYLDAVNNWKFCPQCGSRNSVTHDFCNQCGHRFPVMAGLSSVQTGCSNSSSDATEAFVGVANHYDQVPAAPVVEEIPLTGDVSAFLKTERSGRDELIPILKSSFLLGSDAGAVDYCEKDSQLNPVHAKIIASENGFFIVDLYSRSGSWVNGVKLEGGQSYPLKSEDIVVLADTQYLFDLV